MKTNNMNKPNNSDTPAPKALADACCSSSLTKDNFLRELSELLGMYNAEIEASDHYQGYAECGEEIKMIVDIPAIYDDDYNILRDRIEIDLGNIVSPQKTNHFRQTSKHS